MTTISASWENRLDGRPEKKGTADLQGGNTRENLFCSPFRTRSHGLFEQGKSNFDVLHCEALTDVTIYKDSFIDKGDVHIEMMHFCEVRKGIIEIKIQPKAYDRDGKLMPKVALKEDSSVRCIEKNHPMVVLLRWNPLEYPDEAALQPQWLVLSVDQIKTLGADTVGWASSNPLREYPNKKTGGFRYGWRLFENNPPPYNRYDNKWIDWMTFEPASLVDEMLEKIWDELGKQS